MRDCSNTHGVRDSLKKAGDKPAVAKVKKINSMRLLDANSIAYEVHHYDPQIRDAELVSLAVGLPADEVFKTLVVEQPTSKKPALVMLPCNCRLNLKRLAKTLREKKVTLAPHASAEKLTGLQVGGISALALMQKNWDVYIDRRGLACSHIVVSGGQRGTQLRLKTKDLISLLGCKVIDVADRKEI